MGSSVGHSHPCSSLTSCRDEYDSFRLSCLASAAFCAREEKVLVVWAMNEIIEKLAICVFLLSD